ncbi:MAG: 4-(cytidine 5'-diphospho)-2-C-methyl-D-erythritol kinase [Candidatus Acetothermia bacterium]|jgi:4-diphosphocytidyl-2-C-methyl-D-erythritol kinase|nr:4-(cytidine 5'-diphospho)-2-C-methyl-D-erythritol kinase [Candidatus Acetothermia bacterium]MDH7505036.1 4-(cytidine 5'-diphospho)-2-C-methyl-D-erythritol kinase [Candidatus Acetothermia bacterium]
MRVRIRAYAKTNLGLRVLGRREDGYHQIQTVMQSISLADELVLEPRPGAEGVTLEVEPDLGLPAAENLAYRAARLILERAGCRKGVHIRLSKGIPAGAGLGGASSDGAATLAGLNELLGLGFGKDELKALGLELGSDVPFFFEGGTCSVSGRGERVKRLPRLPLYHLVLLVPPFPLPTPEVYAAFDKIGHQSVDSGDDIPGLLRNDLQRAALALRPELEDYRDFLRGASAEFWGMSGSGPAWFAGFSERERAAALAARAAGLPGQAILTETIERSYECC